MLHEVQHRLNTLLHDVAQCCMKFEPIQTSCNIIQHRATGCSNDATCCTQQCWTMLHATCCVRLNGPLHKHVCLCRRNLLHAVCLSECISCTQFIGSMHLPYKNEVFSKHSIEWIQQEQAYVSISLRVFKSLRIR